MNEKEEKYSQMLNKYTEKGSRENCLILSSLSNGYIVSEIIFYGLLNDQS